MGDGSGSWNQADSWQQQGGDPWSNPKGRMARLTKQCFYFDKVPFAGHGIENDEWLFAAPPGTAITDTSYSTMTKEEHDFKCGTIQWPQTWGQTHVDERIKDDR